MSKRFSIIDIETTGGMYRRDKITEIAIAIHDGTRVIDKWETLINPERSIPNNITMITGITNDMVATAPKFYEVAKQIVEFTEGCIFVAHNVRFDYSFIREEFKRLGFTYTRKQLCTVRLSRQIFPEIGKYSLGSLIRHFNIRVNDRHRAMEDVLATVQVFDAILSKDQDKKALKQMLNLGIRESRLPKNLSIEKLDELPHETGVYYFYNESGQVIYIGKAKNVRKRVVQHFLNISEKAGKMQQRVHDITCELTGSELMALLFESAEIRRLHPEINKAQKTKSYQHNVYACLELDGFYHLRVGNSKTKKTKENVIIAEFSQANYAKNYINRFCAEFLFCLNKTSIGKSEGPCIHYSMQQCAGACVGAVDPQEYNAALLELIEQMQYLENETFILLDKGREENENSAFLIEEGVCTRIGYINSDDGYERFEDIRNALSPYQSFKETGSLIFHYMNKHPELKVIYNNL